MKRFLRRYFSVYFYFRRKIFDQKLDFTMIMVFSSLIARSVFLGTVALTFFSQALLGPALVLVSLTVFDVVTHLNALQGLRRLMLVDVCNNLHLLDNMDSKAYAHAI